VESGRTEPLPVYVALFAIAEKLRVPVHELTNVPLYWHLAAQVMLEADEIYRDAKERERENRT